MNTTLKTPFGRASLSPEGYYRIHSLNKNRGKYLHRLIWEDFYKCEIPKGYVIHHKNSIKTDNCILNLQLIPDKDHRKFHMGGESHPYYGKNRSEKVRKKMSKSHTKLKNTTGYFGVTKIQSPKLKQGFRWGYHYRDENGKRRLISSVNLEVLKQKVLAKGLPWEELDEYRPET